MIVLHTIALLLVGLSPAVLWAQRPRGGLSESAALIPRLAYLAPFLIVGVICSLLLCVHGVPLAEWALPTFAIIAAAFIAPSARSMRWFSIVLFVICIGLCADGLWLRGTDYTSSPSGTAGISAAVYKARLSSVREQVKKRQLPAPQQPTPVQNLFDEPLPSLESVRVVTEWHTPITGLFRINRGQQEIWLTGMDGDIPQLEARPSDASVASPRS